LFSIRNKDNKIKKCYFELKNGFNKLNLLSETKTLLDKLIERYPTDIQILFESLKTNILVL